MTAAVLVVGCRIVVAHIVVVGGIVAFVAAVGVRCCRIGIDCYIGRSSLEAEGKQEESRFRRVDTRDERVTSLPWENLDESRIDAWREQNLIHIQAESHKPSPETQFYFLVFGLHKRIHKDGQIEHLLLLLTRHFTTSPSTLPCQKKMDSSFVDVPDTKHVLDLGKWNTETKVRAIDSIDTQKDIVELLFRRHAFDPSEAIHLVDGFGTCHESDQKMVCIRLAKDKIESFRNEATCRYNVSTDSLVVRLSHSKRNKACKTAKPLDGNYLFYGEHLRLHCNRFGRLRSISISNASTYLALPAPPINIDKH